MKLEFDANNHVKLPRIPKNRYFLGPEYYGCFGTFRRPMILHCKHSGRYIVGHESDVSQLRGTIVRTVSTGSRKRVYRQRTESRQRPTITVWAFTTRAQAIARFSEMCREVIDWNEKTRREHEETRKAATAGDLDAAARLMDF